MAAWLSYDVEDHDTARRLWTFALDTARRAEDHPRSTDLAVGGLLNMAHQARHLRRPREALELLQLASITATQRRHSASAIAQSLILTSLGWCRASLGEVEPCRRAIGQGIESFIAALDTAPPWHWTRHASDTAIAAFIAERQGHALFLLSLSDSSFAPGAIEHLHSAVDAYDSSYARPRAIHLPDLVGAYFRMGDLDTAVTTGYEAVAAISTLSSKLAYAGLRVLGTVAEPFGHKPEVAELRQHIRAALAAA